MFKLLTLHYLCIIFVIVYRHNFKKVYGLTTEYVHTCTCTVYKATVRSYGKQHTVCTFRSVVTTWNFCLVCGHICRFDPKVSSLFSRLEAWMNHLTQNSKLSAEASILKVSKDQGSSWDFHVSDDCQLTFSWYCMVHVQLPQVAMESKYI